MSNYSSCIFILTQLIGFEKSDNDEKIALPDGVEIATLVEFKHFLQNSKLNDQLSSYEMKMAENNDSFWSCIHCTYNNPIQLNTCQMCSLPRNVCINQSAIFHPSINKKILHIVFCLYIIFVQKKQGESFSASGQ